MTIKQAEYLARESVDAREWINPEREIAARAKEFEKQDADLSELIGLWPDFPRDDEP